MSEIKNVGKTWMAQNTPKCNHLTPLYFKGLKLPRTLECIVLLLMLNLKEDPQIPYGAISSKFPFLPAHKMRFFLYTGQWFSCLHVVLYVCQSLAEAVLVSAAD